jgi:RNA polymerase sigma-70 factor (ECF subfamily)
MAAVMNIDRPVLPYEPEVVSIRGVPREEPSDGELIERVGNGDRDAFEELYRRYARPVLGLALRRLGDRGRAEDAFQDAFAAIWRSASSYDPERGRGGAWLYTVARNAIVDGARRRPEPPVEAPEEPSREGGPDEQAEASWLAWRVHRALEQLPDHERPVIELAYWGGLSQSEISKFLDIPLGTIKTRTRSALTRLADLLEEELK